MGRTQLPPGANLALPPLARSALIMMVLTGGLWLAMLLLLYLKEAWLIAFLNLAALSPEMVASGYLYQLATYMFLHELSSPLHLLLNALLVYFFATPIESRWGVRKTLLFAFGGGVAGGLMVLLFAAVAALFSLGTPAMTIGFSGAALAMLALFCTLNANATILLFFVVPIRARTILILAVAIDFLMWIAPGAQVSFPAHLGGILFGVLIGWGGPRHLWRKFRYRRILRDVSLDRRPKKRQWLN